MAARGRAERGGKWACASRSSLRSFVYRSRSGPAPPASGAGLFPAMTLPGPEEVAVGWGAAGGNAARGRRGRGAGEGARTVGTRRTGGGKGEGAGQRLAGRWGWGKGCGNVGAGQGAGQRPAGRLHGAGGGPWRLNPGGLQSGPEGYEEFSGWTWDLVEPRGPLRGRERGVGAPRRPVPARLWAKQAAARTSVTSQFVPRPGLRAEVGLERRL